MRDTAAMGITGSNIKSSHGRAFRLGRKRRLGNGPHPILFSDELQIYERFDHSKEKYCITREIKEVICPNTLYLYLFFLITSFSNEP